LVEAARLFPARWQEDCATTGPEPEGKLSCAAILFPDKASGRKKVIKK
jgi:hypothetical protein